MDQPGAKEGAVRNPAAIHLQAFNAEFAVEYLEREVEIELAGAGENVRDPILTEAGQMGVADLVGQDGNNRIAADIGTSPNDFAVRIEHNSVCGRAAPGEPALSRVMLVGVVWVRIPFGVSLTADAPDKPGIGAQSIVQRFEKAPAFGVFRTPPADQGPTIDARYHVADNAGLHVVFARAAQGRHPKRAGPRRDETSAVLRFG